MKHEVTIQAMTQFIAEKGWNEMQAIVVYNQFKQRYQLVFNGEYIGDQITAGMKTELTFTHGWEWEIVEPNFFNVLVRHPMVEDTEVLRDKRFPEPLEPHHYPVFNRRRIELPRGERQRGQRY